MCMARAFVSKKRAKALSSALFLLGLAALFFTNQWWPAIMFVIGLPLALRQFLLGRSYDALVTLLVFVSVPVLLESNISWDIFLPYILNVAAIYILCREFLESRQTTEEEKEEDLNHEIEEDPRHKK